MVWHDRVRRTLRGSAFAADTSTWRAPFNIDGFDAVGTGDSGYNADLAIGSTGNWYVAYVDGVSEELRMATIDGTTIGNANPGVTRERVDDGVRGTSAPHIVGADADIAVLASGEVRIVYQDATSIEIEADALSIPQQLTVSIEGAEEGTQITAGQVELPDGVTLISDPEMLVVNIVTAPTAEDLESLTWLGTRPHLRELGVDALQHGGAGGRVSHAGARFYSRAHVASTERRTLLAAAVPVRAGLLVFLRDLLTRRAIGVIVIDVGSGLVRGVIGADLGHGARVGGGP